MTTRLRLLVIASMLLLLASAAHAQSPLLADAGPGRDLAAVGDVDGDGVPDLLGAARGFTSGYFYPGEVFVISGLDGQVLHFFDKFTPIAIQTAHPTVAACGDADGDGVPDFALSSAQGAALVSGADGGLIRTYPGSHFDGVGDVDGDDRGDLAVHEPTSAPGGQPVFVRSGATGDVLTTCVYDDVHPARTDILDVCGVGDVDGDGTQDLAVSGASPFPPGALVLRVFSGATGRLLWERSDGSSANMANVGDLDGDGHAELVATVGLPGQAGVVLSGLDGSTLRRLHEPAFAYGASSVVTTGDVDRDGVADLVFGATYGGALPSNHGRVSALSLARDEVLWSSLGPQPVYGLGGGLAALGDVDGDGRVDVAAGTAPSTNSSGGSYVLFSSRTQPIEIYGQAFGATPTLTMSGPLLPETTVTAHIANGEPDATMLLLVGPTLLQGSPLPGVWTLPVDGSAFPVVLDASGRATLAGRWPAGVPAGLTLYAMAVQPLDDWYEDSNLVRLIAP